MGVAATHPAWEDLTDLQWNGVGPNREILDRPRQKVQFPLGFAAEESGRIPKESRPLPVLGQGVGRLLVSPPIGVTPLPRLGVISHN